MRRPTVLIVDDESYIREFLAQILSEHFQVAFAKNGAESLEITKNIRPDIVILDILMPGKNGIETCKHLREQAESKNTPIIMLTALNDPEQRIKAFNAGADDYLSKPFLPEELVARIKRKLEKISATQLATEVSGFCLGNLQLQFDDRSLEVDGVSVDLGQIEYKILSFLMKKRGALVSRQELNDYIWGDELPSDRALDPHMTSLRKKLQKSKGELKTVYGKGYSIILKEMES